jgi:hypothetical protein
VIDGRTTSILHRLAAGHHQRVLQLCCWRVCCCGSGPAALNSWMCTLVWRSGRLSSMAAFSTTFRTGRRWPRWPLDHLLRDRPVFRRLKRYAVGAPRTHPALNALATPCARTELSAACTVCLCRHRGAAWWRSAAREAAAQRLAARQSAARRTGGGAIGGGWTVGSAICGLIRGGGAAHAVYRVAAPRARPLTPLPPAILTASCTRGGAALFAARRRCSRRSLVDALSLRSRDRGAPVPRAPVGAVQVVGPAVAGPAGINGACGGHRSPSASRVAAFQACPHWRQPTHTYVGNIRARELYVGPVPSRRSRAADHVDMQRSCCRK